MPCLMLSDEYCEERRYTFDDWRSERDAEEGARAHDALEGDYSNADTAPDADIPF